MVFPRGQACFWVLCCIVNYLSIRPGLRWQGEGRGTWSPPCQSSPLSLVLLTLNSLRISSCVSPRRPGIVEFRKESLSFSDNLNILTMQLSYSAAWFCVLRVMCALSSEAEESPCLSEFINWHCPWVRWVGAKEESSRRILLSCFHVFLKLLK